MMQHSQRLYACWRGKGSGHGILDTHLDMYVLEPRTTPNQE